MKRVMIVDDALFMRQMISKILLSEGYDICAEASSGREAVEKYKEFKPDGVLLDITMPNMDGLTTLKELLKMDPGARVAMVTAMGQQSMVMEALKTGAKDFVVKPFPPERLQKAAEKALA